MGLESVEFLMEIEKEFSLTIPDREAAKIETIGQLHAYLISRMDEAGDADAVWTRIKTILVEKHRIAPDRVKPEAQFIDDLGFD